MALFLSQGVHIAGACARVPNSGIPGITGASFKMALMFLVPTEYWGHRRYLRGDDCFFLFISNRACYNTLSHECR